MKRHGLTFTDAAVGIRLINQLKALSIDEEDAFIYVRNLHTCFISNGMIPQDAAKLITELAQLSKETRLPPSKVPSYVKEKLNQLQSAEKELAIARTQRENEEKSITAMRNEKKDLVQGLQEFPVTKEKLSRVGVSISDAESVARLVHHAKGLGFDPAKIVTTLNSVEGLKQQEGRLRQAFSDLETNMTSVRDNLLTLGMKAAGYQAAIPYIDQLRRCGIDPFSVSTACGLLIKYGLDFIELERDLAEYHGLKDALSQLNHMGEKMKAENLRLWKENLDLKAAKQTIETAIQVWNQDGKKFLEALDKEVPKLLKGRADEIIQKHVEVMLAAKDKAVVKYLDSKFAPLVIAEYEGKNSGNENDSSKIQQATIAALTITASIPTVKKETQDACVKLVELLKAELVANH